MEIITLDNKESVLEKDCMTEAEWHQWQIAYGTRRKKLFSRILELIGIHHTRLS